MTDEPNRLNILAVDTATEACSAAVLSRGVLYKRFAVAPRQHHSLIFEMCQAVLKEARIGVGELEALVYGRGPGSFTGVRIAASLVQGLAYARALPVAAVSNLQTVALQALDQGNENQVLVAMDARMEEVYYGYFEKDRDSVKAISDEGVIAPNKLSVPSTFKGLGAGSAWPLYRDSLKKVLGERLVDWYAPMLPEAATMLRLAMPRIAANNTLPPAEALPIYLRHV